MHAHYTTIRAWLAALSLVVSSAFAAQEVALPASGPLVVRGSVRVAKGEHRRVPSPAVPGEPACLVRVERVEHAVIDLRDVTLRGASETTPRDELAGYGVYLTDCRDVVIRGGTLSGLRGGIVAERCDELRIENVRFDGNFAQRLRSTAVAEDEDDWLWPHDNDRGEWLAKYGAAISITSGRSAIVSGCRARRGQNGLLLTRCENARVFDNDFSFLSGWGIALYRSTGNVIARNRCDYCVRGYSAGRYARGQDSAGILLFERCTNNVIAENSARCGGDGFFLFAGQDLVEGRAAERGETDAGGSDRNTIYRNDFSCAVANGIETTFSRDNRAIENVATDCLQHGLWGGYSSRMVVARNDFSGAQGGGITIEHGQECVLLGNLLERCAIGLELYWDEDPQFVAGAFGRAADTSSRDHWIVENSFASNDADVAIDRTTGLTLLDNVHAEELDNLLAKDLALASGEAPSELPPKTWVQGLLARAPSGRIQGSTVRVPREGLSAELAVRAVVELPQLPGVTRPFDPSKSKRPGLESLVLGEWGPWDFESGESRPEPRPFGGVLATAKWSAKWFSFANGPDPRGDAEARAKWRALADDAAVELEVGTWLEPWAGQSDVHAAVGDERFGLIATARVDLPAGKYRVVVTSDDGVRLSVDGKPVIDDWTWHTESTARAELDLAAGPHDFALEYFQLDGAAALSIDVTRR